MTLPFANIPQNIRVPLFYAEVNNSQANSASQVQRSLIIGQITGQGTAVPNVPVISQGVGDAAVQGGQGSVLALMTSAYVAADPAGEVWYLPLADAVGATAAGGSITVTATPTSNGTLALYIGGQLISVPIQAAETEAAVAASIVATATALGTLPVSLSVDSVTAGKVNLTALNMGLVGNDIDIRLNYLGAAAGQSTPAGLALTITPMSGGATNPSLNTALANLGDEPFDFIVCPYNDAASLSALQALLSDQNGRWSWSNQVYGHVFTALRGTLSTATTFLATRNNQHETIMPFNDSPTPAWVLAADLAGTSAASLRNDPGLPLQYLTLSTFLAPPVESRFTLTERNTLLYDGGSTFKVNPDGSVILENIITTYQTNAFGQADNSYLEIETMFLLMYVLRYLANFVITKYGRMKLADDGTRFAAGLSIVTPSIVAGGLIAAYQTLESLGFVQDSDTFAQQLIVQRNASNRNRLDILWPGTLIDQLRIFALLAQFRL